MQNRGYYRLRYKKGGGWGKEGEKNLSQKKTEAIGLEEGVVAFL